MSQEVWYHGTSGESYLPMQLDKLIAQPVCGKMYWLDNTGLYKIPTEIASYK